MGDNSVNSYDLRQAQRILTALKRSPCPGSRQRDNEAGEVEQPSYLSLSRQQGITVQNHRQPTPPAQPDPGDSRPEESPQSFETWEGCITWCMTVSRAEAAFVVDSQGFIIACRGRIPSQGFEGAGAELICSIEQLERIAPDSGKLSCVDLEFDKKRMIGFVTSTEENELYIVGLVSPETLTSQTKQKILHQISSNLPNMN